MFERLLPTRLWERRDLLADGTVAVLLYGALAGLTVMVAEFPWTVDLPPPTVWTFLAGATVTLPLVARRRLPLTTLVVVAIGILVFRWAGGIEDVASSIAVFLALYSAGAYGKGRASHVVRGLVVAGHLTILTWSILAPRQTVPDGTSPMAFVLVAVSLNVLLYGAAWVMGDQSRIRRLRERELAERTAELEVERDRSAQRAAVEERLRIARELHDVLGHHVSVMGVQAAGARRVLATDPARAEAALAAIEGSSRHAVLELQRVLKLLRDRGEDALQPQAGLAGLDAIVDVVRRAGVVVTLQRPDRLPMLPASIDLAATRIVQEALTNTLRHAGAGTSAWVRVQVGDGRLSVEIDDDGRGRPGAEPDNGRRTGSGNGLIGMRERAELHGGGFDARPRHDGGFRVAAWLPLEPEPVDAGLGSAAP